MGSPLATKLSSPSFVSRIFGHALEDSSTKSGLVHSLSVCISLLDPRRSVSLLIHSFRGQHMYEAPVVVNPETVRAMLPRLGDLLMVLNVTSDEKILPMPYGELRPPLGKHRLKVVEFIAVLLKARSEDAENELVKSGTIKRAIDLFFEYPYNNALHHHVESIISSCLESRNDTVVDHLFGECDLIRRIVDAGAHPVLSGDSNLPTVAAVNKKAPRVGNLGHLTLVANKILQLGQSNSSIQTYLQDNSQWNEWHATVLQDRNVIENVYRWACGRPTTLHDRTRDSDDDYLHEKDYDVTALANNLSLAFRPDLFGNEEEGNGAGDHDDEEDVYFDDESAEVVISSLRLGDDQGSLFTNSNWFTFRDEGIDSAVSTSLSDAMNNITLNETTNGHNSSSDDEVIFSEDEGLTDTKESNNATSTSDHRNGHSNFAIDSDDNTSDTIGASPDNKVPCLERPVPDWANRNESSTNPFIDNGNNTDDIAPTIIPINGESNGDCGETSLNPDVCQRSEAGPSFEDVEFVGVEPEQALNVASSKATEEKQDDDESGAWSEFNDANYWRADQEVAVLE